MSFSSDNPLQTNQIPVSMDFGNPSDPEFIDILSLRDKRIVSALNTKESALFLLQETASFQQWFTTNDPMQNRNGYRACFDMVNLNGGPIAVGATVNVAHNLTGILYCTHMYGGAKRNDGSFIPLPYVSATVSVARQVEIYATATNIVLVNGAASQILTQAYIVFEYLKN